MIKYRRTDKIGGDETAPYDVIFDREYPIPDRYMETRIASVKAAGGWSNMDYLIEMEK
jgi:hypothetical protein